MMITNTTKSHNKIDAIKDIDVVPSNVQSARQEALLYVFEDNECRDNPHNSSFSLLISSCVSAVCCSQSVVLVR